MSIDVSIDVSMNVSIGVSIGVRAWCLGLSLAGLTLGPACDRTQPPASTARGDAAAKGADDAPDGAPDETRAKAEGGGPAPTVEEQPKPPQIEYAEAGGLHYLEIVTGGADPSTALPMRVAIHGLGDRPESFSHLLDAFPQRARVLLPRGIDDYEGGFSWFGTRARDPDVDKLASGIGNAADVIAKGLAVLAEERPTKGKPIVTGFSQGGMLTFALAIHHPEVVGYAVPVGGWLPPPLWPGAKPAAEGPTVVALHGTDDAAVRYEPTKAAVEKLAELEFPVTLQTYEGVPHAIVPPMHRDLTDLLVDAVTAAAAQPEQQPEQQPEEQP